MKTEQLSWEAITGAAAALGVEACSLRAVLEIEAGSAGFLPDGRPKILFEGHVFWKELQKRGINPELLRMNGILYPKWTNEHYKGGASEWERLNLAAMVNKEAALCSASYGLFQLMGFNHRTCGFATVQEFVDAQAASEAAQLESFCAFMRTEGLARFLAERDWAAFARRYNGPGYAANQYDIKLRRAYERCAGER